jgi:para-nitrobenzyl esterase
VWGNLVAGPKDPTFKLGGLKAGKAVSARLRRRWLSFAVDGKPSAPAGEPQWRSYRKEDRATLVIDAADRMADDLDRDLRVAWGDQVLSFR